MIRMIQQWLDDRRVARHLQARYDGERRMQSLRVYDGAQAKFDAVLASL